MIHAINSQIRTPFLEGAGQTGCLQKLRNLITSINAAMGRFFRYVLPCFFRKKPEQALRDRSKITFSVSEGKFHSSLDDFSLQRSTCISAAEKSSRPERLSSSQTLKLISERALNPQVQPVANALPFQTNVIVAAVLQPRQPPATPNIQPIQLPPVQQQRPQPHEERQAQQQQPAAAVVQEEDGNVNAQPAGDDNELDDDEDDDIPREFDEASL